MEKRIRIWKILIDILLYLMVLLLMEFHLLPEIMHEILGILFFAVFLIHVILNRRFYQNLFKGKYSMMRISLTIIDFLLLLCLLLTMVSSLFVSRVLFSPLHMNMGMTSRILHQKGSAYTFVLSSDHLGMHLYLMENRIKRLKEVPKRILLISSYFLLLLFSFYGGFVFFQRRFYEELFFGEVFKEVSQRNPCLYFFGTFCMSVLFVSITYILRKLGLCLRKVRKGKKI